MITCPVLPVGQSSGNSPNSTVASIRSMRGTVHATDTHTAHLVTSSITFERHGRPQMHCERSRGWSRCAGIDVFPRRLVARSSRNRSVRAPHVIHLGAPAATKCDIASDSCTGCPLVFAGSTTDFPKGVPSEPLVACCEPSSIALYAAVEAAHDSASAMASAKRTGVGRGLGQVVCILDRQDARTQRTW